MSDKPICILEERDIVGESPIWHPTENLLYWVDIFGKRIHKFNPAALKHTTYDLDQPVTSIAIRQNGGLIASLLKTIVFFDTETGKYEIIKEVEKENPENRFNDGKCDRQGRFWAGTMNATTWHLPGGAFYKLDSDLSLTRVKENLICSNGMGWSPDGRKMYLTESFRYTIFEFDFDPIKGQISNERIFATVDPQSQGFPDGLTVDAEGHIWSAQCGLGQIVRYAPNGKIDRILKLPVPRVTSCIFGGTDYRTLYITTARETMSDKQLEQWPLSGSLFSCKMDVSGIPETPFEILSV
jgi:sugar lactone lactonase YvrE